MALKTKKVEVVKAPFILTPYNPRTFLKTFCLFLILIRLLPIFMKSRVISCDGISM